MEAPRPSPIQATELVGIQFKRIPTPECQAAKRLLDPTERYSILQDQFLCLVSHDSVVPSVASQIARRRQGQHAPNLVFALRTVRQGPHAAVGRAGQGAGQQGL